MAYDSWTDDGETLFLTAGADCVYEESTRGYLTNSAQVRRNRLLRREDLSVKIDDGLKWDTGNSGTRSVNSALYPGTTPTRRRVTDLSNFSGYAQRTPCFRVTDSDVRDAIAEWWHPNYGDYIISCSLSDDPEIMTNALPTHPEAAVVWTPVDQNFGTNSAWPSLITDANEQSLRYLYRESVNRGLASDGNFYALAVPTGFLTLAWGVPGADNLVGYSDTISLVTGGKGWTSAQMRFYYRTYNVRTGQTSGYAQFDAKNMTAGTPYNYSLAATNLANPSLGSLIGKHAIAYAWQFHGFTVDGAVSFPPAPVDWTIYNHQNFWCRLPCQNGQLATTGHPDPEAFAPGYVFGPSS